jgi:hypothetical protein
MSAQFCAGGRYPAGPFDTCARIVAYGAGRVRLLGRFLNGNAACFGGVWRACT